MPDLIPAIIECIILICDTLLQHLDEIIVASQELLLGIIEGLILATPDILAAIPGLIASMLEAFGELGPQLIDMMLTSGQDMIQGLVDGIRNAIPNLIDGVSSVASTIADYLHFSVPEKGPLADFDESGSDMIDTFIKSMNGEDVALERALIQQGNIIYNGMTNDYSGQLEGISSQLGALGGDRPMVLNVYLGTTRIASQLVTALDQNNYLLGGT